MWRKNRRVKKDNIPNPLLQLEQKEKKETRSYTSLDISGKEKDLKRKAQEVLVAVHDFETFLNTVQSSINELYTMQESTELSESDSKYSRMFDEAIQFCKLLCTFVFIFLKREKDAANLIINHHLPLPQSLFDRFYEFSDVLLYLYREEKSMEPFKDSLTGEPIKWEDYADTDIEFYFILFSSAASSALKMLHDYQVFDLVKIREDIATLQKIKRCAGVAQFLKEQYLSIGSDNDRSFVNVKEIADTTSKTMHLIQSGEKVLAKQVEKDLQNSVKHWHDTLVNAHSVYHDTSKRMAGLNKEVRFQLEIVGEI